MSSGHVSTFRQNDWTAGIECAFSVSRFYREIAKNSRHLFEKYPKFTSHMTVARDSKKTITTRFSPVYPTQTFLRDRNTLTRGEKQIIEGINRNRAEIALCNTSRRSESQNDPCSVKTCHENPSLGRTVFMAENICGKSIFHQDDTASCNQHSSPVGHASRNKHSTSLHSPSAQDTRGLILEKQTKYSTDYLIPCMTQHCQKNGHATKETTKQIIWKDQNKVSFLDDVIVVANDSDAVVCKHHPSSVCHTGRNKHNTTLLSQQTHDTSGLSSENRTKHSTSCHASRIQNHYQREGHVVKEPSTQTRKELNMDSFVDEATMAFTCKVDNASNKAHSQPGCSLAGADESLSRLQPPVRDNSTLTPMTSSSSHCCSAVTLRSEKTGLVHTRAATKSGREGKKTEEWATIVECTRRNNSNIDNLNAQQRISEEASKKQVNVNSDSSESRWHKAIQIYIPTAEAEFVEDDDSLKPEPTRRALLCKERPLSHEEFQNRLKKKSHRNTVLCHE